MSQRIIQRLLLEERLPCGRLSTGELSCGTQKEMAEKNRRRLTHHVESRGLNASETRDKILEVALIQKSHFSIQDLVKAVRKKHKEIGFATIYRNVALFLEASILNEAFTSSKGISFYELNREVDHDHVQCLDCGKIFEFQLPSMDNEIKKAISSLAFSQPISRNIVYARCDLLNKNSEERI